MFFISSSASEMVDLLELSAPGISGAQPVWWLGSWSLYRNPFPQPTLVKQPTPRSRFFHSRMMANLGTFRATEICPNLLQIFLHKVQCLSSGVHYSDLMVWFQLWYQWSERQWWVYTPCGNISDMLKKSVRANLSSKGQYSHFIGSENFFYAISKSALWLEFAAQLKYQEWNNAANAHVSGRRSGLMFFDVLKPVRSLAAVFSQESSSWLLISVGVTAVQPGDTQVSYQHKNMGSYIIDGCSHH